MILHVLLMLCVFIRCGNSLWSKSGLFDRLSKAVPHLRPFSKPEPTSSAAQVPLAQDSSTSVLHKTIPPVLLAVLSCAQPSDASPLNPQSPAHRLLTPFFQGWLVRAVDHSQDLSFIFIVGSFSSSEASDFTEHYIFCAANHRGNALCHEESFPDPDTVTVSGSSPSGPTLFPRLFPPVPLNVTWRAQGLGCFRFTDGSCSINFQLGPLSVKLKSNSALPWDPDGPPMTGPEGWLGYMPLLLPCHYFVHSVGSRCSYSLTLPSCSFRGNALCHIEGNHGTFFPSGWIWSQAVSATNEASVSLVAGLFEIGGMQPLNCVLYVRSPRLGVRVFRTTDMDRIEISDGLNRPLSSPVKREGRVGLRARSRRDGLVVRLDLVAPLNSFGPPVHIPTRKGFSSQPGCRESYTAVAKVRIFSCSDSDFTDSNDEECGELGDKQSKYRMFESFNIPMACLEFGNSFV